jgi:uracil-DNA glycosylase family 4|tara:strand:- start:134 stop:709 length:576 start_codon:yes stop_codon:yes gene_type:complete
MKCNSCKDIVAYHKLLSRKHPLYHCNPVVGSGNIASQIVLIGLAPGLHGANKTGVPFTSDYSGEIIRKVLRKYKLDDIFITNAVKCCPKNNKPSTTVINNCKVHTMRELNSLSNLRVIIALGEIAYYQILELYNIERKLNKFKHGQFINLNSKISLIASYHCSKLNFNTHRINIGMLEQIFYKAKKFVCYE